jgi:hypothetical protein
MSSSGILYDAVTACKTALTALGLVPITDPRNARPLSVLIELPTVTAFTYNGLASVGGQDLPTYDLSVAIAVKRS